MPISFPTQFFPSFSVPFFPAARQTLSVYSSNLLESGKKMAETCRPLLGRVNWNIALPLALAAAALTAIFFSIRGIKAQLTRIEIALQALTDKSTAPAAPPPPPAFIPPPPPASVYLVSGKTFSPHKHKAQIPGQKNSPQKLPSHALDRAALGAALRGLKKAKTAAALPSGEQSPKRQKVSATPPEQADPTQSEETLLLASNLSQPNFDFSDGKDQPTTPIPTPRKRGNRFKILDPSASPMFQKAQDQVPTEGE